MQPIHIPHRSLLRSHRCRVAAACSVAAAVSVASVGAAVALVSAASRRRVLLMEIAIDDRIPAELNLKSDILVFRLATTARDVGGRERDCVENRNEMKKLLMRYALCKALACRKMYMPPGGFVDRLVGQVAVCYPRRPLYVRLFNLTHGGKE